MDRYLCIAMHAQEIRPIRMFRKFWLLFILVPLALPAQPTYRYFRHATMDTRHRCHFSYELLGADTTRAKCYRCIYEKGRLVGFDRMSAGRLVADYVGARQMLNYDKLVYLTSLNGLDPAIVSLRIGPDSETYLWRKVNPNGKGFPLASDSEIVVRNDKDSSADVIIEGKGLKSRRWEFNTLGQVKREYPPLTRYAANLDSVTFERYDYSYDSLGRAIARYDQQLDTSTHVWSASKLGVTWEYDANSNVTRSYHDDGVATASYDSLGYPTLLKMVAPHDTMEIGILYDRNGNISNFGSKGQGVKLEYDSLNQPANLVTFANREVAQSATFSFVTKSGQEISTMRVSSVNREKKQMDTTSIIDTYDAEGNRVSRSTSTTEPGREQAPASKHQFETPKASNSTNTPRH